MRGLEEKGDYSEIGKGKTQSETKKKKKKRDTRTPNEEVRPQMSVTCVE